MCNLMIHFKCLQHEKKLILIDSNYLKLNVQNKCYVYLNEFNHIRTNNIFEIIDQKRIILANKQKLNNFYFNEIKKQQVAMKNERGNVHHRLFQNLVDSEYNKKLFVLNNSPKYLQQL